MRDSTLAVSFADAKQSHWHRYARFRGLMRVAWPGLLAAAVQNIKKIATVAAHRAEKAIPAPA